MIWLVSCFRTMWTLTREQNLTSASSVIPHLQPPVNSFVMSGKYLYSHNLSYVDHFFILQHEDLGNNYNLYFDHFDPYFYNPSVVKEFLAPLKSKNSWHDTDRIKICKLGQLFFGWRFYMYTRLRHGTKGPKGASTPIPAELWAFCQAPWFDS